MTDWPADLKIGPIREWPGAMTPQRRLSPFRATLSSTLTLLRRELKELGARNAEMLIAVTPGSFRQDGRPYANAKPDHPGIIVSFDAKAGHLSYPADSFTTWQDNLRAVALSLDALRKVDRYGVTKHGEQYRGFLAIEAAAAPTEFATASDALLWLARLSGASPLEEPRAILRLAKRAAHPDQGGDAAAFQRVMIAEAKLRSEGML